jgi:hypothetical protein
VISKVNAAACVLKHVFQTIEGKIGKMLPFTANGGLWQDSSLTTINNYHGNHAKYSKQDL